ncbi:strictosidine synthase-like 13 [Tanacetum coccineum]
MEKKKRTEQEDGRLLQHHLVLLVAIVIGLFVIVDPFDMSPVGGHDFRPVRNDIAPYDQVMESWPDDNLSRLGLGNLEFVDQVYGPESLEFDPLGNGPYTGLADGRIVKWAGKDRGWETFALVSQKWQPCCQPPAVSLDNWDSCGLRCTVPPRARKDTNTSHTRPIRTKRWQQAVVHTDFESSDKKEQLEFGELEWLTDYGVFGDEATAEVPQLPASQPMSNTASYRQNKFYVPHNKKPRYEIMCNDEDDDEHFTVPDLG